MIDVESKTWLEVKNVADGRIAKLREDNDSPGHSETTTAFIRGQIEAWKWLLDLPNKQRNAPPETAARETTAPYSWPGME